MLEPFVFIKYHLATLLQNGVPFQTWKGSHQTIFGVAKVGNPFVKTPKPKPMEGQFFIEQEIRCAEALSDLTNRFPVKARVSGIPDLVPPSSEHSGPTETCNWVIPTKVMAGSYPGDLDPEKAKQKISSLLEAGRPLCLEYWRKV